MSDLYPTQELRFGASAETHGSPVLRASDVYDYYRPSVCELRVWLRRHGAEEADPGPYELVLRRLGERHEQAHLRSLPEVIDLSGAPRKEREARTLEEIRRGSAVIYQPAFSVTCALEGIECRIVGYPDFLIREGEGYVIRDSKLARRVGPKPPARPGRRPPKPDHPEILRQLEVYGWLYEQVVGAPPVRLEVHSGTGAIVAIPYDGAAAALSLLATMARLEREASEPYSPVGWTKCGSCGFRGRCWPRAEATRDIALIGEMGQERALALRAAGVSTMDHLLGGFDEESLAAFSWTRRRGKKPTPMGSEAATRILRNARALDAGEEIVLGPPGIPDSPSYAMFDIEGLPPQLDELEKIYLWGLQVFGERTGEFLPATAGFGPEGDHQAWLDFLANARSILETCGDLPFVHWHGYEPTKLRLYIHRFGDPDGTAMRVLANLLDLCKVAKDSVVLPLPSYSLKMIEKHVGLARKLPDYGGDRAMATYIEAVETEDPARRDALMGEILAYNREDLEATWAVLTWLKGKRARAAS